MRFLHAVVCLLFAFHTTAARRYTKSANLATPTHDAALATISGPRGTPDPRRKSRA